MANDITTAPNLWDLDTVGAVKAANSRVKVHHVHFEPTGASAICTISEYDPDGSTARNVIRLKAGGTEVVPVDRHYNPPKSLNGLYLSTITNGHVFLEVTVDPQPA